MLAAAAPIRPLAWELPYGMEGKKKGKAERWWNMRGKVPGTRQALENRSSDPD